MALVKTALITKKELNTTTPHILRCKRKENFYPEVLDLLAVRVLVKDVKDCYLALGVIHFHLTL